MKEVDYYRIIIAVLITLGFFMAIGLNSNPRPEKVDAAICHDYANFEESVSTIQKNCGSMFITFQYGKPGMFVYVDGGYKPIEECLS